MPGTARWTGNFASQRYRTITDVKVGDFASGMRTIDHNYAVSIAEIRRPPETANSRAHRKWSGS